MIIYRYQWFFIFNTILSVKIVLSPAVSKREKAYRRVNKTLWIWIQVLNELWNRLALKFIFLSKSFVDQEWRAGYEVLVEDTGAHGNTVGRIRNNSVS